MSDIAIRVEGLSKRYRIGQREPYKAIRDALAEADAELVYFDRVLNEAISVLARRTHEQRRPRQLDVLLDHRSCSI